MAYNWQKHVKPSTIIDGRAGGVRLNRPAPKALRFSSQFYLRWAYDELWNARVLTETQDEADLIGVLLELMEDHDDIYPFLTASQRQGTKEEDS